MKISLGYLRVGYLTGKLRIARREQTYGATYTGAPVEDTDRVKGLFLHKSISRNGAGRASADDCHTTVR